MNRLYKLHGCAQLNTLQIYVIKLLRKQGMIDTRFGDNGYHDYGGGRDESNWDFRYNDMSFSFNCVMGTLVLTVWLSFIPCMYFRNILCTHSECNLDGDDDDDAPN